MERTSRLKRAVWLGGISCVLALSVLLVGAAGICGPRMPKLLIAACPVLWITSGWTLWDAIKVLNDENWDRLNSGALGIIAAAVGVFSLSGFMALIGLLNL